MNEYSDDDGYDMHAASGGELGDDEGPLFLSSQEAFTASVNFDDPDISSLPRVLLMGPRRGGKTSIQVSQEKGHPAQLAILGCCKDWTLRLTFALCSLSLTHVLLSHTYCTL
jgi:hypothetical protein